MKDSVLYYSVGPLLYCPADNQGIVPSLIRERFGKNFSLAMCLEDTIADRYVEEAEKQLVISVKTLYDTLKETPFFMPKLFIRVRRADQIEKLIQATEEAGILITGFIIPKFSLSNADVYIQTVCETGERAGRDIYMMPILEDPGLIDLRYRHQLLYGLKEKLSPMERLVLNIRVGGNDLCHRFGFRRSCRETIHSISAISGIFSDIITVFGMDYVVSGPVWEYYRGEGWDTGLKKELAQDRLCGFTGKTVIHPNQIELVNAAYRVSQKDLADARSILAWDTDSGLLVSGSASAERMNEYKVHKNWARRILMLSEVFGNE